MCSEFTHALFFTVTSAKRPFEDERLTEIERKTAKIEYKTTLLEHQMKKAQHTIVTASDLGYYFIQSSKIDQRALMDILCQPIAKKAPAASSNSRKWLMPAKLSACNSVTME